MVLFVGYFNNNDHEPAYECIECCIYMLNMSGNWYNYTFFFCLLSLSFPTFAEASCKAAVRSAKGFVEDVGKASASKSAGLLRLSTRAEENAERDCHSLLVDQFQLGLPIPKTQLETSCGFPLPVLRLRDWARFLLDGNHSHILVGLKRPDWKREASILKAFWSNFKKQHEHHPVFAAADAGTLCLERTFPMVVHGDEGRGRKHAAYLVCNMHSVLGRGLRKFSKKPDLRYCKMSPNYHGHTYTSRFLLAALPKILYTGQNDQVFTDVLQFIADEVQHMFCVGEDDTLASRGRFHMVLVAIAGDWPFLADSGFFERSYRSVQKTRNQKKHSGICHLCAGGRTCHWEQINTLKPHWLESMFSLPLHADGCEASPLETVPHVPGELPGLWAFDTFHTMHLGVCKSFSASCLALLSELQPESSIDERFASLSSLYLGWCQTAGERPWVSKLTKELLGWMTTTTFPNGTWHKGALSTTLMTWIQCRFESEGSLWPAMLQEAGEACVACNSFLRGLYDSEAWIAPVEARRIAGFGHRFLVLYQRLARQAFLDGRLLWVLQPKHHSMHHLVVELHNSSFKGKVLNCLCVSTQADEDFIGRPSRLSRRVTPKPLHSAHRVLERYLQSCYGHWVKEGYLIPSAGKAK